MMEALGSNANSFTPAEFALEMIEGVEGVRSKSQSRRFNIMGAPEKGPALSLVPMNLTAMCVSPADVSNPNGRAVFGHVAMDFDKLPKPSDIEQPYSSKPVLPDAFVTTAMTAGIRLHWALPDALTRGEVRVTEADNLYPEKDSIQDLIQA